MKRAMTIRKWYGDSIYIPSLGSQGFNRFVGSSVGIVSSILGQYLTSIEVRFGKCDTAEADQERGIIRINEDFLTGRVLNKNLVTEDTIAMLCGLIVHEAAHFAYSPKDLSPFADYVKAHTDLPFHRMVAVTIGNIVEDIYIEAAVDRQVPSLSWMLEYSNDVFFDEDGYGQVLIDAFGMDEAPEKLGQVASVLNALIYAKILDSLDSTYYISDLFRRARTATELEEVSQRFALTLEIYNRVMERITEEECKNGDKDGINKAEATSRGLGASHENRGDALKRTSTTDKADLVNSTIRSTEECKVTMTNPEALAGLTKTTLYIEKPLEMSRAYLPTDPRYTRLSELARQRATVNRPFGEDRNRGNSIRKLYRIATDNKIFAERIEMTEYKPMQVMIVVDCSGSMANSEIKTESRAYHACRAALGAAQALCEARCSVAVFGHTAELLNGSEVTIYRAKDFSESADVLPYRMQTMLEERMSQNRDGYALEYLSTRFTRPSLRRLMIVISDGQPMATDYSGSEGMKHTQSVVNAIRAKGIDVLSISITNGATKPNDFIYGAKHNVYNQDPNIIERIVQSLLVN